MFRPVEFEGEADTVVPHLLEHLLAETHVVLAAEAKIDCQQKRGFTD
jgi:hypothetical protein